MCAPDSPRGFDATHSWHVNIHQHDPYTTVRNEFDRGFTSLAFAGHHEIVHGSQGGDCREPETGLVVNDPNGHPLVRHLDIVAGPACRTPWCTHHTFGVHTTSFKPGCGRRGTSAQP